MEELLDEGHLGGENSTLEPIEDRLKNLPKFDLGRYFSESGKVYGSTMGPVIGFLLIVYIASVLVSLMDLVIPYVSSIVSWLIITPMQVGVVLYYARAIHKKDNEFGNLFSGFKFYTPVIVGSLLQGLIIGGISILLVLVLFFNVFVDISSEGVEILQDQFYIQSLVFEYGWLILVFVILILASSVLFMNLYTFILLRKVSAPKAINYSVSLGAKKFFPFLGLLLILAVMNMIGALFLVIGLLFTIPLSIGILVAAFDHLIGSDSEIPG